METTDLLSCAGVPIAESARTATGEADGVSVGARYVLTPYVDVVAQNAFGGDTLALRAAADARREVRYAGSSRPALSARTQVTAGPALQPLRKGGRLWSACPLLQRHALADAATDVDGTSRGSGPLLFMQEQARRELERSASQAERKRLQLSWAQQFVVRTAPIAAACGAL